MARIEQSIDIDVPVRVAYNQWTQFEEFPRFMEHVKRVRHLDERRLEWTAEIAGHEDSWEAQITEQEPNRRIVWRAIDGKHNSGTVDFQPANGGQATRLSLQLEYEPEGLKEIVGRALHLDEAGVRGDLRRFKEFIESRQIPSGSTAP